MEQNKSNKKKKKEKDVKWVKATTWRCIYIHIADFGGITLTSAYMHDIKYIDSEKTRSACEIALIRYTKLTGWQTIMFQKHT